jgi:ComF family protein
MNGYRISRFSLRLGERSTAARGAVAGWLGAVGQAVDALVFPWSCAVCGVEGQSGAFCPVCREDLMEVAAKAAASVCPRCALPGGPYADFHRGCAACRGRTLGFDAAMALGPYEGTLRDLCLRLKHERNAWLAPCLSELWAEARGETIGELASDAWIVPVPLHWRRHWRRGYNQAEALARGLARRLHRPVRRPLRRVVATDKLAGLSRTERTRSLRGAFRARRNSGLDGRTIILVDDVLTTGATCGAAARALKQAGARRVVVAVIARTGKSTL